MKNVLIFTAVTIACFSVASQITFAQKGMGDQTGMARQQAKPKIVSLSGTLVEVRTGSCETTTGRSTNGTHLILENAQKQQLNIHLGPEEALADTVAKLSTGQQISVKAFRTKKMKKNHHVAQSLTFDKTTVTLRDKTLRPVWAQGKAKSGAAFGGQGRGQGRGQGWRHGQRWQGGR